MCGCEDPSFNDSVKAANALGHACHEDTIAAFNALAPKEKQDELKKFLVENLWSIDMYCPMSSKPSAKKIIRSGNDQVCLCYKYSQMLTAYIM